MSSRATTTAVASETKLSIGFINWAHALDHYVMLIFPTVVIGLEIVYGRSYAELIALGTPAFIAFGVFSLPAGWLGDRWSRRNMMVVFYAGCGLSLVAAGVAPDLILLPPSLSALGVFAAIFPPVRADPQRAHHCDERARCVRGDLPSRRHRHADPARDPARPLACLQRRMRQSRRGTCRRHDGGAPRRLGVARGLPGAGGDLRRERRR